MPYLLDSICTVIAVFYKYAKRDGDCFTLNRREMKRLIQKEFSEFLENPRDPQTVEIILQLLDFNEDSLVDFSEFLILVFRVAKACYSYLQPSKCLPQPGEARGARGDRDPQRDERTHHQPWDNGERAYAHERGGSALRHTHPAESSTRREERRDYLAPIWPVGQTGERNHQARNLESRGNQGRSHQSCEPWGREDYVGLPRNFQSRADVETHPWPREPGLQWNEAGYREPREREPTIKEEPLQLSQDLESHYDRHHLSRGSQSWEEDRDQYSREPTREGHDRPYQPQKSEQQVDKGYLKRPRESEPRLYEGSSYRTHTPREVRNSYERHRPSHEPQAWEDERREDYPRGEERRRPYDFDVHGDEAACYQSHGCKSVDDYEQAHPLPRTGGRREPEAREDGKRGQRYDAPNPQESEESRSRSREGNRRRSQPREQEPREDDWRQQQYSHPEPQRVDQRRAEARDTEPREEERRRPETRDAEAIEGVRRRPHDAETGEGERRPHDAERSERERRRPQPREQEPREDDWGRQKYSHPEPQWVDRRRAELHDHEPREERRRRLQTDDTEAGIRERTRLHDAEALREGGQRRPLYYEYEPLETESRRRRPELYEPEPREGGRRRPQASERELREEKERRPQPIQARSRDDERKRSQSREPLRREDGRRQSQPRDSEPNQDERRMPWSHEPDSRGSESARPEARVSRGEYEPRSQSYYDPRPREGEQNSYYCSSESNPREHDQSRPSAYEAESRRTYVPREPEYFYDERIYYESEAREDEWSRPQTHDPKGRDWEWRQPEPRGSELYNGRQPQSHEPESRQDEKRRTHVPREPESRDGERTRLGYYAEEEGHEIRLPSCDLEQREDDQRRGQPRQSELEDGGGRQLPQEMAPQEDEQRSSRSRQQVSRNTENGIQQIYDHEVQDDHQRSQQYASEDEQRRSQQPELAPREAEEQRRSQELESEQREVEQRRSQKARSARREDDHSRPQQSESSPREVEEQRRSQEPKSEQREGLQRRSQQHETQETKVDQGRYQQHESESREGEQRRSQPNEGKPMESQQRRPWSRETPAIGDRRRLQPMDPESSTYDQQLQQLHKPKAEEGDLGGPQLPHTTESRGGEQGAEEPRESGPSQNIQMGQGGQGSPVPRSKGAERPQTRGPESQRCEQRRQEPEETVSRTQPRDLQTTKAVQSRSQSGEPKPDPRAATEIKGSKRFVKKGTQEQSGTPEPERTPVPDVSHGEGRGRSLPMETEGISQQVQEFQPPLEEENQAGTKKPRSNPEVQEPNKSHEKPELLAQSKAPLASNPLYEYLVAQKK